MPLKFKILLLGLMNLFLLAGVISLLAYFLVFIPVNQVDENRTVKGLWRSANTLETQLESLGRTTADWSEWDETWKFITDSNLSYQESNLTPEAYSLIEVDEVIYLNRKREVVFSAHFDFENLETLPLSNDLGDQLSKERLLGLDIENVSNGVLFLPEREVMLVANPILNGKGEGPSRGLLIMVRELTDERLNGYARTLNHKIEFLPKDSGRIPQEASYRIFSQKDHSVILTESPQLFAGFSPVSDLYGEVNGLIRIEVEREVKIELWSYIWYFASLALVINILIFLLNYGLISKKVIRDNQETQP